LVLVSCLIYLGMEGGLSSNTIDKLYVANPNFVTPLFSDIASGELWRLITPIFLHFGMVHILFNMLWLYQLGSLIETIGSSKKLLMLIVVTGIFSNLLQYLIAGPRFGGMSGVIYGLLSYAWGMGRWQQGSLYYIDKGTFGFMMIWLVLCFFNIFGPVANYAHLGGLVIGIIWAKLESGLGNSESPQP
jgi:GlpG protein